MSDDVGMDDRPEVHGRWTSAGRGLVEVAWQRKLLVALGLTAALVLGALYYVQARAVYESTAQVLVLKKRPDTVTGIDTRHLAIEDYVATQQVLIQSPLIVEGAIRRRDLHQLACFQNLNEDLGEVIRKGLHVARNRATATNNNVLMLAFRAGDADDVQTVLNAVIDSYKDFLDETYRNTSEDTVKLITQARDVLQKELAKQEEAYRKFRREAPLLTGVGKEGLLVRQDRLSNLEAKLSGLLVRKAELQGYVDAIEDALKRGTAPETILPLAAEWAGRVELDASRTRSGVTLPEQLLTLLQEEQQLLQARGERHPEVIALRKRIEVARGFLASPAAAWRTGGDAERPVAAAAADPIRAYRDHFQQQLQQVSLTEKHLGDALKVEQDRAKELSRYEIEDEGFRTDLARTQKLYDGIIKRLQEVDLVRDIGGYDARTIAPPIVGKKVQPSAAIVLAVALAGGLTLGMGLAYLAELSDKSFRSVEEVRRRLGLPIVGQLPHLEPVAAAQRQAAADGAVPDPMLYCHHRPLSPAAEAYRGVRTALYFSVQGKDHQVIQVTSPHGRDGKSTLAANLAVSIAQSGKTVILIDADLRKPRVHKIFGLSAAVGLGSIIAEGVTPDDAIRPSGITGLAILPCGPIPPNPAELLTSPRFQELLEHLRARYDYVVVDTPPLLAVTDPSVVAPRVDGVLLNIRLTKNGRPHAERAKDMLDGLGVNILGVVVNDAEGHGPGGYGGYGGYGYAAGYYADDESEVAEVASGTPAGTNGKP